MCKTQLWKSAKLIYEKLEITYKLINISITFTNLYQNTLSNLFSNNEDINQNLWI